MAPPAHATATSPRAAHCIASHAAQRTDPHIASRAAQRTARMQPARTQRIASQTIRANTSYRLTPANNTFSNTCPIMVNHHAGSGTTGTGIVPSSTVNIVAGLYMARPPTTSFAGINVGSANVAQPLTNCRLYYSQVTVDPQKSIDYVQRNRNKQVIYRSFVTNSYTNITVGSSFNPLVNSGIVHPTAVLICPFIGAVSSSGFGDFQWKVFFGGWVFDNS
jgi:hypothetical protein